MEIRVAIILQSALDCAESIFSIENGNNFGRGKTGFGDVIVVETENEMAGVGVSTTDCLHCSNDGLHGLRADLDRQPHSRPHQPIEYRPVLCVVKPCEIRESVFGKRFALGKNKACPKTGFKRPTIAVCQPIL